MRFRLKAVMVMVVPAVLGAGVPERVAVPLPIAVNVTPLGSCPDSESAGSGLPVAVTMFEPGLPTVRLPAGLEVMLGASPGVVDSQDAPFVVPQSSCPDWEVVQVDPVEHRALEVAGDVVRSTDLTAVGRVAVDIKPRVPVLVPRSSPADVEVVHVDPLNTVHLR